MGTHAMSSNKKRTYPKNRRFTVKRQLQRSKNLPKLISEIPDLDIAPESTLRQRKNNSRTNVGLSGKKKRKINKTLKRLQKSKDAAKDVVMEEEPAKKEKKSKKKDDKVDQMDIDG